MQFLVAASISDCDVILVKDWTSTYNVVAVTMGCASLLLIFVGAVACYLYSKTHQGQSVNDL